MYSSFAVQKVFQFLFKILCSDLPVWWVYVSRSDKREAGVWWRGFYFCLQATLLGQANCVCCRWPPGFSSSWKFATCGLKPGQKHPTSLSPPASGAPHKLWAFLKHGCYKSCKISVNLSGRFCCKKLAVIFQASHHPCLARRRSSQTSNSRISIHLCLFSAY